MKPITERHVQAIWYDAALRPKNLTTRRGSEVRVVSPGEWNLEAGPDFRNAVLEVGKERRRIIGDVEVHLCPSDWDFHRHGVDPNYRNVVAHVTWGCGPVPGSLPSGAGDELTGSLTREPGLTVGSYAILLGSLTNRNYEISFVGANYVIVAPVIVPDELKDRKVFDEFKNWLVSQMYLTETATDAQVVEMADSVVPLKGGTLLAEFIAGTDPADINSRLRALISMEGTRPIIRWEPALNGPGVRTGVRIYRVWGAKTCRGPWIELAEGDELEKDVRFFKVSVGLP